MKKFINHLYTYFSACLIFLSMWSCERFIDTEVPTNQIGTAEVYSDVSSANAALAGLYAELWSSSMISGDVSGSGPILGTYTDDLICYAPYIQNGLVDLYNNAHIPSNTIVYNLWSKAYKHIYYSNAIIEGVTKSNSISQVDKERIISEATVLRSLLYYNLSQIYNEVPYTDTTDYLYNSKLKKNPQAELLSNLENDLKGVLPKMSDSYGNQERIFVNKKVGELLLAKVLITNSKYSESETILSQIIQSPLYTWESDLNKVFLKTGKHILWQLKPANASNATKEFLLYNFTVSIPAQFSLSDALVNSFEQGDLRKQTWILPTIINQKTYFRPMKYRNPDNANTTENSVVFRIEEAYLLYAESLANQNKIAEAKTAIDKVRQRAGLIPLPTGLSREAMLDKIADESRHEFFAEMGHRFLDLKRMKKTDKIALSKPSWKTFHNSFPIPEKEIIINPNLNPQNNGY